jgi:hypothetical protein
MVINDMLLCSSVYEFSLERVLLKSYWRRIVSEVISQKWRSDIPIAAIHLPTSSIARKDRVSQDLDGKS